MTRMTPNLTTNSQLMVEDSQREPMRFKVSDDEAHKHPVLHDHLAQSSSH